MKQTMTIPTPGELRAARGLTGPEACQRMKPAAHKGSLYGAEKGQVPISTDFTDALAAVYGRPAREVRLSFLIARRKYLARQLERVREEIADLT